MRNILFATRILQYERFIRKHLGRHGNVRREITSKYYYTTGTLHSKRFAVFFIFFPFSYLHRRLPVYAFSNQQTNNFYQQAKCMRWYFANFVARIVCYMLIKVDERC